MTMTKFKNPIFSLMLASIFFTSCNGQTKTNKPNDTLNEQQSFIKEQTKTVKLQSENKTATIGFGIQDKSGNIWLASNGDGVHFFDGINFSNYREEDGLDNNIVYSILEDKKGNIWVGTKTGLNHFDGNKFKGIPIVLSSNTSTYLINSNNNVTPTENGVWSMMQDKNGTIWFGTDDGVYCYNGKEFIRFLDNQNVVNKDGLNLKGIFSILEAKNGNIWFAECAGEGVSSFDGKSLSIIIPYKEIGRTDRIIEDKQNILWFATAFKGIGKYVGNTYTQNIFKAQNQNGSYNIIKDANGNLWFDIQDGLGFYDGKTLNILTEKDGTITKEFIPILLDKSGNLWFSSKGMKLFKYDGKTFTNYSE